MNARDLAMRLLAVRDGAPLLQDSASELALANVTHAYAVADHIVTQLEPRFGPVAGFKIGATSLEGQKLLGLSEPFYGRVLEQWLVSDGAIWDSRNALCTVEAEVGFVMSADLPPRAQAYSALEVRAAIAVAIPLLEINRPAYAKPFEVGGLSLIADNGVTQGFVMGAPGLKLNAVPRLPDEKVCVWKNGHRFTEGHAAVVMGDPLKAVTWLANALRAQGRGLHAGQVLASGAMTAHAACYPGDAFTAEYSTLGRVSFSIGAD